ncbi:MAG: PHP domain-containing protein, partial [Candidatus Kapaibacterium sp.]
VDLRRVHEVNYGAALMYFTGSKEHNVGLRKIAQDNDWKLNEYGLFDGDDRIAGKSEKEVYDKLGLIYIPPELRENRGEIDAAKDGKLPDLVTMDNIKGELHAHTKATDGKNTIREMADAARDRGYSYIAITEHSKEVHVAGGLGADELRKHTDEIEEINEDYHNFKIMKGVEVDILESGELDLPDDVLKRLDYVLAAVHYNFDMPEEKMTKRMLKAMDNKHVNAIAHPFGKKINEREPYPMDFDKILEKAKERGIFLEMNGNPQRFDLDDVHCKAAKEAGVKIAIGTDSHSTQDLDFMRNSVAYARRGWLEKSDVVNTRTWTELKKLL